MQTSAPPALLIASGAFAALLLIAALSWLQAGVSPHPDAGRPGLADELEIVLRP